MTWTWDRGYTAEALDREDSDPLRSMVNIMRARDEEDERLAELRSNPEVIALVQSRTKKSIGRTADIPIRCGSSPYPKSLAFGVLDGRVELIMIFHTEGMKAECRLTGNDTAGSPPKFPCRCDVDWATGRETRERRSNVRRTRLWLFEQGIRALAKAGTTRPSIQLHTT